MLMLSAPRVELDRPVHLILALFAGLAGFNSNGLGYARDGVPQAG